MGIQIDVATDVLPGTVGTLVGPIPAWAHGARLGDALDGNATLVLPIPNETEILALCRMHRVLRVLDVAIGGATSLLGEYRIGRIEPSLTNPIVQVTAYPILQDLNWVRLETTLGGVPTFSFGYVNLPTTDYITDVLLPILTAKGLSWIGAGTISLTTRQSLSWTDWKASQLLAELTKHNDYTPRLRYNTTQYLLDIVDVGASAASPVISVGRNVEELDYTSEGAEQATIVIPRGTPAGSGERRGIEEYGVKVLAPQAADIVTVDPGPEDTGGPIILVDQEKGTYGEVLMIPYRLRDDSTTPVANEPRFYQNVVPRGVLFVPGATAGDDALWVTGTNSGGGGGLLIRGLRGISGGRIWWGNLQGLEAGIGSPRDMVYHAGTDQVFVTTGGSTVRVYDSDGTFVTAITVQSTAERLVYCSSVDRIYVYNAGTPSVSVINPATNAVTATIALATAGAGFIVYDVANDRVVVATGTNCTLQFINPATNTVANSLALNGNPAGMAYSATNARIYVSRTGGGTEDIKVVDGSGTPAVAATITALADPGVLYYDAVAAKVWAAYDVRYLALITPASNTVAASGIYAAESIDEIGAFDTLTDVLNIASTSGPGYVHPIDRTSMTLAARRLITASDPAVQEITFDDPSPAAQDDVLSFRSTLGGTWRSGLVHPTAALPEPTGYGRRERILQSDLWSGERNYVTNPLADEVQDAAPLVRTWDRSVVNSGKQPDMFQTGWDASGWTTFAAQADGAHSAGVSTVNLKAMTPGDVLQPGAWLASVLAFVANRVVVDGSGEAVVKVYPVTTGTLSDGATVTIHRAPVSAADTYSYRAAPDARLITLPVKERTESIGVDFAVPYASGRTQLKCGVEFMVWPILDFVPDDHLELDVKQGGTTLQTVSVSGDATAYSDRVLRTYILSTIQTVEATGMLNLRLRIPAPTAHLVVFVKRFYAGYTSEVGLPEVVFYRNGSEGMLYTAGWRAVRDLAEPPIHYVVRALEDDPAVPFALGARAVFEHHERGVTGTPRIVSVRRALPGPGDPIGVPELELDNRPRSLVRTLAQAGIS